MKNFLRRLRDVLVSLRLTVLLIALGIVLVFAATLDQVNLGVWAVQEKYFRSFFVWFPVRGLNLPVFPGGYLLGGIFFANLLAAHLYRFAFSVKKSGLWLTHAGLLLLLAGELLSGLWQRDYQMRLDEGQTRSYAESYRDTELVVTDVTDPAFDDVVAIPESYLAGSRSVQHPKLPFRIVPQEYHVNAALFRSPATAPAPMRGFGAQITVSVLPPTYKQDERNQPVARVELLGADGSLGTWLVGLALVEPQRFDYAGRTWEIALRVARRYQPFSLTLLKFSHDRYAGTDIPKNFSSRLRLTSPDGHDDREVLIYMNNPLRYGGLTFYQSGFANNDRTTVLQVVRNPSWLLPYVACALMALGLVVQFGLHLFGFMGRRTRGATPAATPQSMPASAAAARSFWPLLAPALAGLWILVSLFPGKTKSEFDLDAFGRLPVQMNGRIKPLDTIARSTLLQLQGRQRVVRPDGRSLAPLEWLLEVMARPAVADACQTFEIVHPDLLTVFNLTPENGAGKKRFSFQQLAPRLRELERQSDLAEATEAPVRTAFQRAVLQLRDNVLAYEHLQIALVSPDSPDFLAELQQASASPAATRTTLEHAMVMAGATNLALIPPAPGATQWQTAGAALVASLQAGRVDPVAQNLADLARQWRQDRPAEFNRVLAQCTASLQPRWAADLRRCRLEARFNAVQPFYTSMTLYVVAFLLAIFSWLRWPAALGRAARWLVVLAWALATAGILARMWLEGRPPVTNLYSSALFVGWMAVALCLVLEWIYRNAIGSAAAGLIGFATLLIAHHLALGGDTLEMMRAVLDSNFWLATHVVTVTVGYAATFLAGFLALIYVARGVFTKSLDPATADALTRMVYGIVCFATLFSFVGTVLGGIWADQSWGRFWGWDPKENGALIIVLWNSLILHARWGGLVRQRGLMALALFGNVVTAWSWFGVNMLGVGLHSYGFMDAAFWWLIAFAASQVVVMGCAGLERSWWRSPVAAAPA
ncbi:MAG: cytochrome biosis protein [Lacunisphaera sp.]|nr:cytochrome biosis protein [Lacunisphaera sp.]